VRHRRFFDVQVHAIREREDGDGATSTGFLARLAKKIRDNLEIHIKNFRVNVVDARDAQDGRAYRFYLLHVTQRTHTHTTHDMHAEISCII